jgi:hypothetical protein
MINKKIGFVFFTLFVIIISLSFFFNSSSQFDAIGLSITRRLVSRKIQTNFTDAVIKLVEGKGEVLIQKTENNTCYWITPIKQRGYYLEIKKYSSKENDCNGEILEEGIIPTGKPIGIIGETNCLCGKKITIKRIDVDTGTFFSINS